MLREEKRLLQQDTESSSESSSIADLAEAAEVNSFTLYSFLSPRTIASIQCHTERVSFRIPNRRAQKRAFPREGRAPTNRSGRELGLDASAACMSSVLSTEQLLLLGERQVKTSSTARGSDK